MRKVSRASQSIPREFMLHSTVGIAYHHAIAAETGNGRLRRSAAASAFSAPITATILYSEQN